VVAAGLVVAMAFAAGSASGAAKLLTVKKAKKLFYLESEAEARFLDATEGEAAFLADDVKIVVETVPVANTFFSGTQADCPPGYEAVGGGVAGSSNLPIVQTQPDLGADYPAAGTYESASGWRGYFGPASGDQTGIVLAVCAK
jgi:hypothetical protein